MQRGSIFGIPAPGIFKSKFPGPPRPRGESPRSGNPGEKQEKSSIVLLCMSIYFCVHSIHPFHTPTQQRMLIVIILHFKLCLIGGGGVTNSDIVSLCCTNQILDKNNEIWYLLTTTTVCIWSNTSPSRISRVKSSQNVVTTGISLQPHRTMKNSLS